MLDDYIEEQKVIHRTITNLIRTDKIGHAYIIESNGYSKALDFSKAFSKSILCPFKYTNSKKCNECSQCLNIDRNEFIELKIIDPDGIWIKKGELEELQDIFSKKSIIGNKKVYIINNANKLNESSSNSILKFLEEPEEGITAILIVDNINSLLSTIVSRCQVLSLVPNKKHDNSTTIEKIAYSLKNNNEDIDEFIETGKCESMIKYVVNFVNYYEENHFNTIIYMNKIWHQYIKDKSDFIDAFSIMILFYKDILNYNIGKEIEIFNDYIENIEKIKKLNTKDKLIYKINAIIRLQEKIKFNANNNLLMDKLIIDLEGSDVI